MFRWMQVTAALGIAAAASLGIAATLTADENVQVVQIRDDCDPATFNAAIGPGTCVGDGDTTFDAFRADVLATGSAEQWRFNPDRISEPRKLVARNRGGETHTFTQVDAFGGGVVPLLNVLPDTAVVAHECANRETFGASVVPSGMTAPVTIDPTKPLTFQCCIHPWMRTTVSQR